MKYLSYLLPLLFCALGVSTAAGQQKCDAGFTATVKCNTVTFKPDSLKAGIKYAWDFGVAGLFTDTSTQQMPTYIYFNADSVGVYTFQVRLILVDGSCIDTVTKTVTFTIGANDLPDASMLSLGVGQVLKAPFLHCKASPPPATFTLNVQNNSSSTGANALYQIAWGDSTKLDTLTPAQFGVAMHTYLRMGLFNINLIVTGKNGCVDSTYYKFFNGRNPAAGIGVPLNADLCVPSTIEFDYTTDMVNNPPGTIYTYTVDNGDGTPFVQEIPHQLPIQPFSFLFAHGSCEPGYTIGMKSPPEQFVVSMVASNLCGQDDALTTPSLSTNGTPRFEMPADTCIGSLVTILNTSDSSYYWDSDNQMCVNDMFVYWEISGGPFNLVSGTLGNPMTFQPGTNKLEVRFNAPVVYTVKFTYTPGQASPCPPGILSKTICILPEPIAQYSKSQSATCAPVDVTITNTSNTLTNCRAAKYDWGIDFLDSDCGDMGAFVLLNGTDTSSAIPPQIRFTKPGRYRIRLKVENECGMDDFEDIVNVADLATSVMEAIPDSVCGSLTVTPKAESTNACNGQAPCLRWTIPNPAGGAALIFNCPQSPPSLTYNTPGTYVITLETSSGSGCGTSVTTQVFTVLPLPALPTIAAPPVCEGSTLTMSVPTAFQAAHPNYRYTWSRTGPPAFTGPVLVIPNAKPSDGGAYTVTVTDVSTTLRCTSTLIVNAVVFSKPPLTITGDSTLCAGQSTVLSVLQNGYQGYAWTQIQPAAPSYISGNANQQSVNIAAPPVGTYLFRVVVTSGATNPACSNTATVKVVVDSLPMIAPFMLDTACVGTTVQLNATANHPGTGTWTSNPPVTPDGKFTSGTPGFKNVTFTFTDDKGCVGARTDSVCVQPAPVANFSLAYLPQSKCIVPGQPLRVTTTNLSNTLLPLPSCFGARYRWEVLFDSAECHAGPGAWSFAAGSATSQAPVFNFTQSGRYTLKLTVTNACGTNTFMQQIEAGQSPQAPQIEPVPNACGDTLICLKAKAPGCNAANNETYAWTWNGSGLIAPQLNPPCISVPVGGPYTVTLSVTNVCGSAQASQTFRVEPPPAPPVLQAPPVCEGSTLVLSVQNPLPNHEYIWSRTTPPFKGTVLSIPSAKPSDGGAYTVTVTDLGTTSKCTVTQTVVAVVHPKPKVEIKGDTSLCVGESTTLTAEPTTYLGYAWAQVQPVPPPTYLLGSGSSVTVNAPPVGTYQFRVTVTDNSTNPQCTNTDLVTVVVNELPAIDTIQPDTACVGVVMQLTPPSVSHPGTGVWTTTLPAQIVPPNGFVRTPAGTSTATYTFTDDKGCKNARSVQICTQPAPIANFSLAYLPLTKCLPLRVTPTNLSNTLTSCFGAKYRWEVVFDSADCHNGTGAWSFVSGQDTSQSPMFEFTQSGRYTLKLTVTNACGTNTFMQQVEVGQAPEIVAIDSIKNACTSALLNLSVQKKDCNSGINFYQWGVDGVPVSTLPNPQNLPVVGIGVHTVTVTVGNACGTATAQTTFEIQAPIVPTVQLDTTFGCVPFSVSAVNTTTGTVKNQVWTVTPTAGVSPPISTQTNPIFTFSSVGIFILKLTASNDACGDFSWQGSVTASAPPQVTLPKIGDTCLIAGTTFTPQPAYSVQALLGQSALGFIDSILWKIVTPDGSVTTPTGPFPQNIPHGTLSGTYTVTVTVKNRCGTATATTTYRVLQPPTASAVLDKTFACLPASSGQPVAVTVSANTSAGDDLTYSWSVSPNNGVTINGPNTAQPTFNFTQIGFYTITLTADNSECSPSTWTQVVKISMVPKVELAAIGDTCLLVPDAMYQPVAGYTVQGATNPSLIDSYLWKFTDPTGAMTTSPLPIPPPQFYGIRGTHSVAVSAINVCGTATDSTTYRVLQPPAASAVLDKTFACLPATVSVSQNISAGDDLTYLWSVSPSNGVTISGPTTAQPTFNFAQVGFYTITLVADNSECSPSTWERQVKISDVPKVELAAIGDTCLITGTKFTPQPVYGVQTLLGQTALGFIDSTLWKIVAPDGSVTTPTGPFPKDILHGNLSGTYTVSVTVKNECGSSTATTTYRVLQPPTASAVLDKTFVCAPGTVNVLQNTSIGDDLTYSWSVSPSAGVTVNGPTTAQPTFNFAQVGFYTITMVADNAECEAETFTHTVKVSASPQVTLAGVPDSLCEGAGLSITPLATYTVQGLLNSLTEPFIDMVNWSFVGSAGIQTSKDFIPGTIPYDKPGLFNISVSVSNQCGTSTAEQSMLIIAPPTISAVADVTKGCAPLLVNLTNQPTFGAVKYEWDFGDGSPVEIGFSPSSHVYQQPGTYSLKVTVTDGFGCSRTGVVAVIEVQPTPKAGFEVQQDSLCGLPQVLTLKNTSLGATGTATPYTWTMPGALPAFSTTTDPSVSYTAAGLYFIKLVARNQFGCSDSLTKPFTAYERPVPAFTTPDTSGCAPLRVRFDNNSVHWDYLRWEYDGVVDSTTFNPTYTFNTPGTYTVSLIVGNASGCEEKLVLPDLVKARPTPIAAFTFAENFNAWPRTFDFTNTSVLSPSEVPTYIWTFGDGDTSMLKDPSHRYFILEDQVATLLVANQFGCFDTVSARVVLDSIGDLFIPNTLDPVNGEGEQKIFLPKGYGLDAYHIAIFTRTGQLVWESTELNAVGGPAESWNGELRGVDLPGGVYVWKVFEARFSSGRNWPGMPDEKGVRRKTGFLELLR